MDLDIPDPTDWLKTTVPSLQALDSTMRCQVCKEFFTAPMITSCGHTFCSLCIRSHLSAKQKCPICMTTDEESRLRKNTALQELVAAFEVSRPQMIEKLAAKEEEEEELPIPDETERKQKSRRVEKRPSYEVDEIENDDSSQRRRGKRRRQEESSQTYTTEGDRPRRSTRNSSQRTSSNTVSSQAIVIDDSEDDGDFEPTADISENEVESPKAKRKPGKRTSTGSSEQQPCPVCKRMKDASKINDHVNRCLDNRASPSPPPPTNGSASSPMKKPSIAFPSSKAAATSRGPYTEEEKKSLRIAKGNFSLTNEQSIRKKLAAHGLRTDVKPVEGQKVKNLLWDRLMAFANLWNANLDSDFPKTKAELRRELETQERNHMNQKSSIVTTKEFGRDDWSVKHNNGYQDLTATARASVVKKKESKDEKSNGEVVAEENQEASSSAITPELSATSLVTAEVTGVGSPETLMQE